MRAARFDDGQRREERIDGLRRRGGAVLRRSAETADAFAPAALAFSFISCSNALVS